MEHTTTSVLVQALESKSAPGYKNPGDVEFEVAYPADYKGPRHMPEGVVTVSKESAELFTRMGIGNVVEAEAEAAEPTPEEPKEAAPVKTEKKKGSK